MHDSAFLVKNGDGGICVATPSPSQLCRAASSRLAPLFYRLRRHLPISGGNSPEGRGRLAQASVFHAVCCLPSKTRFAPTASKCTSTAYHISFLLARCNRRKNGRKSSFFALYPAKIDFFRKKCEIIKNFTIWVLQNGAVMRIMIFVEEKAFFMPFLETAHSA